MVGGDRLGHGRFAAVGRSDEQPTLRRHRATGWRSLAVSRRRWSMLRRRSKDLRCESEHRPPSASACPPAPTSCRAAARCGVSATGRRGQFSALGNASDRPLHRGLAAGALPCGRSSGLSLVNSVAMRGCADLGQRMLHYDAVFDL